MDLHQAPERRRHTIILTTHYLEEAEALCNRVAMLKGGEIVALDTTANLLRGMSGITVQISADALPPAWHGVHVAACKPSGAWGFTLSGYAELETLLAAFPRGQHRRARDETRRSRSRTGVPEIDLT